MEDNLWKGEHYEDRALQMRGLAAKESNPQVQKAMTSLAETYARLSRESYERAGMLVRRAGFIPRKAKKPPAWPA